MAVPAALAQGQWVMVYNFVKIHKSIKTTPAMEAGVTTYLWGTEDIVMMTDTSA